MNQPLTTKTRVVYSIITQIYMFESKSNELYFENRSGKVLDGFDMNLDPIDMVADQIIESIIEMATFHIDTDAQLSQICEEIYVMIKMFYDLFQFSNERKNQQFNNNEVHNG